MFTQNDLISAHNFCNRNAEKLAQSKKCGCFFCLKIFSSAQSEQTLADGTVLCPHCGIDAVIGEKSGFPITKEFLAEMHKDWFE